MKGNMALAEIAMPYAQALMSVAQSQNQIEPFAEQVRPLLELLRNSEELRQFLGSPIVGADDKKAVLRRIGEEEVHPLMLNFLMLLVDRRRILFLEGIFQQFLELVRQLNQTILAEVTSAVELNEEQRQAVREKVIAMTGSQQVELDTQIDPDLIGGVIIKVGSQVLDASLRGQLRRISQRLTSGT